LIFKMFWNKIFNSLIMELDRRREIMKRENVS